MYEENQLQLMSVINDLDALIGEMDNNPSLSPWVVRLILKSIKDKAKKTVIETVRTQYIENILTLDTTLH